MTIVPLTRQRILSRRSRLLGLFTLIAISAFWPCATAQSTPPQYSGMLDASDPERLARYMQRSGYEAEIVKDDEGNPQITGRLGRTGYSINFYECERGAFCNSIQFFAWAPAPEDVDLETVNRFNASWRYVRASLANDQVRLQMDVNLDAGVTADNFGDTLDIWRQLLDIFERELRGLPSTSN